MTSERIGLFLPTLRGGGAEKMIVHIANALVEKGFSVDLVLAKAEGVFLDRVSTKVNVIDLNAPRVLFSLPGLVRYLKKNRPIVLISTLTHSNIVALWAKWFACVNTRVVIRHASVSSGSSALWDYLVKYFYPYADAIVAISKGVARYLAQVTGLPLERFHIIYNPVLDTEDTMGSTESFKHPWLLDKDIPVILAVGRLVKEKDFKTLIKAFAEFRKKQEARLIILGEGKMRGELEALIKEMNIQEYVDLPGFVRDPLAYMKYASVFVSTSLSEGFGNVIVEALASGTPVIATNCEGGPTEILENGKYGLLVSVGDVIGLCNALKKVLNDNELRRNMRILGKKRAMDFTVSRIIEDYIELISLVSLNGR